MMFEKKVTWQVRSVDTLSNQSFVLNTSTREKARNVLRHQKRNSAFYRDSKMYKVTEHWIGGELMFSFYDRAR